MNDVTGERTFANGQMLLRSVIERSLWRVVITHIVKDLRDIEEVFIYLLDT